MGTDAVGSEATPEQLDAMKELLAEAIEAGGLGFSTTLARTHSDGDGQPVASRWADEDELLALAGVVGEHEGTTLEFASDGCLDGFDEDEVEFMIELLEGGRPAAQLERADRRLARPRALPRTSSRRWTAAPRRAPRSSPSRCR